MTGMRRERGQSSQSLNSLLFEIFKPFTRNFKNQNQSGNQNFLFVLYFGEFVFYELKQFSIQTCFKTQFRFVLIGFTVSFWKLITLSDCRLLQYSSVANENHSIYHKMYVFLLWFHKLVLHKHKQCSSKLAVS